MGYIKHNAIIVTGWEGDKIREARQVAIKIFNTTEENGGQLVSEIVRGLANGQSSFFIAPDGSKEGWQTSDNCDTARTEFLNWLRDDPDNYCDYIEVRFGGDDEHESIVRSKDSDIDSLDGI